MDALADLPSAGESRSLPRDRARALLRHLLEEFEITETAYVAANEPAPGGWEWLPRSLQPLPTGGMFVSTLRFMLAFVPPFPIDPPDHVWPGPDFARFETFLAARRTVALMLLRLGAYSFGIATDGELEVSKTGTRYVHGRHRAGGQSQRRFERNREAWIRELFNEACEVATERLDAYSGRIDFLALGGDRHVMNRFVKRCRSVEDLMDRRLPGLVHVDRPNLAGLQTACKAVWSVRVFRSPA